MAECLKEAIIQFTTHIYLILYEVGLLVCIKEFSMRSREESN